MGLNKNRICPLADSGPPTGEVWVARKPAKIPYTIVEMGTGPEGLARLNAARRAQQIKDETSLTLRTISAENAFKHGEGHLIDDLKANKIESIYKPGNDLTFQPATKKTIIGRFKSLFKAIWDSANLSD